jgi:7-cyano-7-deazaguanine reductase
VKDNETVAPSFKDERSMNSADSTRYGKNIIDHFNPDEDLVFWQMNVEYTKNGYWVTMIHPEISALCPVSGYPDSGKVTVEFKPKTYTVELKAFKLWINSYRNVNISHEALANEIYNTLKKGLKPLELYVKLEMMPRGNVTTVVEVGHSFNTCVKLGREG